MSLPGPQLQWPEGRVCGLSVHGERYPQHLYHSKNTGTGPERPRAIPPVWSLWMALLTQAIMLTTPGRPEISVPESSSDERASGTQPELPRGPREGAQQAESST